MTRAAAGDGPYARIVVKVIALTVENSVADSVERIAARDGVSFEEATTGLLREGLRARARTEGKAFLAELRDRSTGRPSDDQAMAIALEEQRATRAERRDELGCAAPSSRT